jgi:hypothetical protein
MNRPLLPLLCAVVVMACVEDVPEETSGSGGGGSGGSGGGTQCPIGSHDEGGQCVATLGAWQAAPSIADARDHHVTFAVGNFLYVVGGAVDMGAAVQSIERSAIAEDGSLGAWETLAPTLVSMGPSVAVADRLVLVTGGFRFAGISAETNLLTVAEDGSLTVAPGPTMLHPRFHHAMVIEDGWVYAVGGAQTDATSQTSVERIRFDAQGAGEWIEDRAMPLPRSHHGLAVHDGAVYAIAGLNRFDGDPFPYEDENFADIIRAPIQDDGSLGEWTTVGQMPAPLAVHAAFVHLDALYVVGGLEGHGHDGEFVTKVQRAAFAEDGSVGAFETLASALPRVRGHCHQIPMVGPVIYSVAGAADETGVMKSQVEAFSARFE